MIEPTELDQPVHPKRRRERLTRAARRERLLKTAGEIISSVGVEGLTITALAEAAEIARPVVYSHFEQRQDIAIALLDQYYEWVRLEARGRTEGATNLREYISLIVDAGLDFTEKYGLIVERISSGFFGDPLVRAAFDRYESVIIDYWSDLLKENNVPKDVIPITAQVFQSMVTKGQATMRGNPRRRKLVRETVTTLILASINAVSEKMSEGKPTVHARSYAAPSGNKD